LHEAGGRDDNGLHCSPKQQKVYFRMPEFWNGLSSSTLVAVLVFAYFCTWLLLPWVLLKRRVHESAAVAWIIAIIFVPFVGALLCVLLGNRRWKQQSVRKRQASKKIVEAVAGQHQEFRVSGECLGRMSPLADLAEQMTGVSATKGNQIQHLPDTEASLEALEEIIQAARRFIHIEFYIWRHDKAGHRIQKLLIEKARAGVEVRLLYDGIGSISLARKYLKSFEAAGIETAPFTPGFKLWPIGTLHLRNHRKIVVVDGEAGFTGGMNIGDEYIHRTKGFGKWRDTQLVIRGPAVLQFQQVFAEDWYYATGKAVTDEAYYPSPSPAGPIASQVVADGPDNVVDIYYSLLVAALGLAQERVTIATPYFVPPDGLAIALQTAARRGVKVRIMIADRGNYLWTKMAGRSYYEALLSAGVEILEFQNGLYHPKTIVVDGEWSLVGTPNCDYRSLFLNFEVAIASFDAGLAKELEDQFLRDAMMAVRITLENWQNRSTLKRLHEEFWRLFAPVL
jgi:cardiolipin synthase A/B